MNSCKFKGNYELVSGRVNAEDCRSQLYSLYGRLFSLPYEHIFSNPDDERGEDYWSEVEEKRIRIGEKYYSLKQKITEDNSIWIEEVRD